MKTSNRVWSVLVVVAGLLLAGTAEVYGQVFYFNSPSNQWSYASAWTNGSGSKVLTAPPGPLTNAYIGSAYAIDATCTVSAADYPASSPAACSNLLFGHVAAGQRGTLNLDGGSLQVWGISDAGGHPGIYMGYQAGTTGILNQTGNSSLSFPIGLGAFNIGYHGYASWTLSGNSVATNFPASTVNLVLGNSTGVPTNCCGNLTLNDNAVISNSFNAAFKIGSGAGCIGNVNVNGGLLYYGGGYNLAVGVGAGAVGTITITNGALVVPGYQKAIVLGNAAGGTGILHVAGGRVTCGAVIVGSSPGSWGDAYVTNNGVLDLSGGGAYLNVGVTANTNQMTIGDNAVAIISNYTYIGLAAAGTGTLTVAGHASVTNLGNLYLGVNAANSWGYFTLTNSATWTNAGLVYVGQIAGSVGTMTLAGGTFMTTNTFGIGYVAGSTGTLNVVNCTQTNITGQVQVGSLANAYGLLTLSNATFGTTNLLTVGSSSGVGNVVLAGTNSVLKCGQLTIGAKGTITNHVNQYSGGVWVTNTAVSALTTNAGCKMVISFDRNPVQTGDFWGMHWSGTNGYAKLVAATNNGWITINTSGLTAPFNSSTYAVKVYTNFISSANGDTYIGFKVTYIPVSGTSIFFR